MDKPQIIDQVAKQVYSFRSSIRWWETSDDWSDGRKVLMIDLTLDKHQIIYWTTLDEENLATVKKASYHQSKDRKICQLSILQWLSIWSSIKGQKIYMDNRINSVRHQSSISLIQSQKNRFNYWEKSKLCTTPQQ